MQGMTFPQKAALSTAILIMTEAMGAIWSESAFLPSMRGVWPINFADFHAPLAGEAKGLVGQNENCCKFLRHIRVKSIDELKTRILQGIEEMNQAPMML